MASTTDNPTMDQYHSDHKYTFTSQNMQRMGTALPVLSPIHTTPLPSTLRLVRGRLGQKNRKREQEGEKKEGRGDEAKAIIIRRK